MQNILSLFALIALLLPFAAQAQVSTPGHPNPAADNVHFEYLQYVEPFLRSAESHEDVIELAMDKFENWSHLVTALEGLDPRLMQDLFDGETRLNQALTYAVETNARDCTTNTAHAEKVVYWFNFTTKHDMLLHLGAGYQLGTYQDRAESCVKVELQLDSLMTADKYETHSRMVVRARIPLTAKFNADGKHMGLRGTGALEYVSADMPTGNGCTVQTQPVSGTITVTGAEFKWTDVGSMTRVLGLESLTVKMTTLHEILHLTCDGHTGTLNYTSWSSLWNGFHRAEGLAELGTFALSAWTASSGQTFASKEYVQNRGAALAEVTTIKLSRQ